MSLRRSRLGCQTVQRVDDSAFCARAKYGGEVRHRPRFRLFLPERPRFAAPPPSPVTWEAHPPAPLGAACFNILTMSIPNDVWDAADNSHTSRTERDPTETLQTKLLRLGAQRATHQA
jgi:hypothetical protein